MDRPLLRAQPTAGPARRLLWSLGPAVLSAAVLVACGSGDDDPPHPAKALPPADTIPSGLDDALQLPDDVEPVAFSYTEVVLEADRAGRSTVGVLVADTFLRRTRGLMHRTSLPPDTGMLFAFPELTTSPFWNKDAPLDLDIAFLDETGVIREIVRLQAFDTTLVAPTTPYLYALEMPAGWFASHAVDTADRVQIPDSVEGFAE